MGGMEEEKKSMQKFDFNIIKIKPCKSAGKITLYTLYATFFS